MKKIVRNHDEVMYLKENRYEKPKKMHLDIIKMIKDELKSSNRIKISDYGCAAGEFEYSLIKEFPDFEITGYEYVDLLIEKARNNVNGVEFKFGDLNDISTSEENSNDFSLSVGVLPIFDCFKNPLNNMIYWTKSKGVIFIHSLFNEYDFDVFIKYNHSKDYNKDFRETGWNIFSKKSISKFLDTNDKVLSHSFIDFNLDFSLDKQQDDYLRSWTFKNQVGSRLITNGLCLLQPHSILKIQIK